MIDVMTKYCTALAVIKAPLTGEVLTSIMGDRSITPVRVEERLGQALIKGPHIRETQ